MLLQHLKYSHLGTVKEYPSVFLAEKKKGDLHDGVRANRLSTAGNHKSK